MSKIYGIPTATPINPEKFGSGGGGTGVLRVTLTGTTGDREYTCSHTSKEIYEAVQNGKTAILIDGNTQYAMMRCHEASCAFGWYSIEDAYLCVYYISDDSSAYLAHLDLVAYQDNGILYQASEPQQYYDVANKAYVDGLVGHIDTALDDILAIQNALIGGDGV